MQGRRLPPAGEPLPGRLGQALGDIGRELAQDPLDLVEVVRRRLVRELAVGANAAVVFPEYDLSPETRYPVALEQNYAVAHWVATEGAGKGLDATSIAVVGDSVGGNMSAALTLMAKERGGVQLLGQVLFYRVTDASFDTSSYRQFAEGYYLRRDAMQWFRDQYTADSAQRAEVTASPLRATVDELRGLREQAPRGRGTGHGRPHQGMIHDFVMLNALRGTHAAEAAITQAVRFLVDTLGAR